MSQISPKTYYIKTFGCQANEADSNSLAGILEALDFEPAVLPTNTKNEKEFLKELFQNCDLFIVNTCSVRQKSEDKVYGIGKIVRELRDENGRIPFMVMSGCIVGSVTGERRRYEFEELRKKTPWADLYINPAQIWDLPDFLYKNKMLSEWALQKYDAQKIVPKHMGGSHAFVNVSFGCDNFCTFCVVPYSRGKEISRTQEEILREINHLVLRGVTEITLCGQNVNSWGLTVGEKFKIRTGSRQKLPFAYLLRAVASIEKLTKVSFISSNPFDFTEDLIEAVKHPKISNYLHIAVQSGNNDVLKKMSRRHTIEDFVELIGKLKSAKSDVEFGTDIIVGFPGETREQFMDTVELFKKIKFNVAFISMYSQRKGTIAAKNFDDDVPLAEKKWRHTYLSDIWKSTKAN